MLRNLVYLCRQRRECFFSKSYDRDASIDHAFCLWKTFSSADPKVIFTKIFRMNASVLIECNPLTIACIFSIAHAIARLLDMTGSVGRVWRHLVLMRACNREPVWKRERDLDKANGKSKLSCASSFFLCWVGPLTCPWVCS